MGLQSRILGAPEVHGDQGSLPLGGRREATVLTLSAFGLLGIIVGRVFTEP